jgi:hypothetical protein
VSGSIVVLMYYILLYRVPHTVMRYGGAKDPRVVAATMGRGGGSVRVRARVVARCGDVAAAAGRQQAAGSRELSRDINTESICYRP